MNRRRVKWEKQKKVNALFELESAESNLSDDIQALAYLQDEYFSKDRISDNFKYSYFEIQNAIQTLLKSMIYNRDKMLKATEESYVELKKRKEL